MAGSDLLIYGSYGYTGNLIARHAADQGIRPILGGRNHEALARQAHELGLEHRAAALENRSAVDRALEGVGVVLHCAGPFARTSRSMADACLRARAHYLDVTGEILVFEALAARHEHAAAAGIMLLPGVGFDVVPTDCLAVHLARRLPGASSLVLAFDSTGGVSRGTATTIIENMHRGSAVRRSGELVAVPFANETRMIDFGRGPRLTVSHPWGDLATAYRSTGIPNITVFRRTTKGEVRLMRALRVVRPLLASPFVQAPLRWLIRRAPAGPDEQTRRTGVSRFWGQVTAADGSTAAARVLAPEAYWLTAQTALLCARRALAGDVRTGFATPAMAYGPDLVLKVPGTERTDL